MDSHREEEILLLGNVMPDDVQAKVINMQSPLPNSGIGEGASH